MADIKLTKSERFFYKIVKKYDEKKYWKYRDILVNGKSKNKLLNYYRMFYIKRCDGFNGASLGTHIGFGADFKEIPNLPHGLCGIFVSHNAVIGKGATIFHQVTIGEGTKGAPVIGDNCYIGAGVKIIGNVHIGNNVKIGANCVITKDIPDNKIVVSDGVRYIGEKEE